MVGYIGPKAIQYNVDNSVVEGDSSIGGDSSVGGNLTVDGNLQVNGSISPPYPTVANANILINPSFTVNQRGAVIEHPTYGFGPDRWGFRGLNQVGGTMCQSTTVVDPATGINKLLVKHRNATGTAYIRQYIEAVNLRGLYGKEMTLSFGYSDTGGSGIPPVSIGAYNSSGTTKTLYDAVPTSLGDNRWACTFTLSIDGTIPDSNEIGMLVQIFPNEKNPAPSEWYLWETKLEVGSVVTPFIARPYGEELALCQRYFQKVTDGGETGSTLTNATVWDTNTIYAVWQYTMEMRASPTQHEVGGSFGIYAGSQSQTFTDLNVSLITKYGCEFSFLKSGHGLAVGNGAWVRFKNAGGYVEFDAEL